MQKNTIRYNNKNTKRKNIFNNFKKSLGEKVYKVVLKNRGEKWRKEFTTSSLY